jgi:hypothetical protein
VIREGQGGDGAEVERASRRAENTASRSRRSRLSGSRWSRLTISSRRASIRSSSSSALFGRQWLVPVAICDQALGELPRVGRVGLHRITLNVTTPGGRLAMG